MKKTVRDEIIEQVDQLDDPQRRRVLEFARQLATHNGTPGAELMRFAGSIDRADLEAMSRAIEEACENVEPNGW